MCARCVPLPTNALLLPTCRFQSPRVAPTQRCATPKHATRDRAGRCHHHALGHLATNQGSHLDLYIAGLLAPSSPLSRAERDSAPRWAFCPSSPRATPRAKHGGQDREEERRLAVNYGCDQRLRHCAWSVVRARALSSGELPETDKRPSAMSHRSQTLIHTRAVLEGVGHL